MDLQEQAVMVVLVVVLLELIMDREQVVQEIHRPLLLLKVMMEVMLLQLLEVNLLVVAEVVLELQAQMDQDLLLEEMVEQE